MNLQQLRDATGPITDECLSSIPVAYAVVAQALAQPPKHKPEGGP